jgi:UDP-N-acetylmuramyl pentapeptide synthase
VGAGMNEDLVMIGKDHQEIARRLKGQVKKEDWLLFKGSRGMQIEKVLAVFKTLGE